jgi:hypothetical protein
MNEARQGTGRLDDSDPAISPEGVFALERHDKIEALIQDPGEGMGRIEPDGTYYREQLAVEETLDPACRSRRPFRALEKADPFGGEFRDEKGVQHLVLLFNESMRRLADAEELLGRGEIVRSPLHRSIGHLLFETRHPDLEEFIEIGAADTKKLQAFEQRDGLILSKFEHAAVELQKTQFPVDVKLRLAEIGDFGGRWHNGRGLVYGQGDIDGMSL